MQPRAVGFNCPAVTLPLTVRLAVQTANLVCPMIKSSHTPSGCLFVSDFFLLSFESERIFLLHCKIENHILPFICFTSAEVFHAFYVLMLQVEEAIEKRELPAYLEKSNGQISELVRLVRTDLQTGVRIAVEALIVLDVHGK